MLYSTTDAPLRDVFFVDRKTGWAVGDGGAILKTTDRGYTWSEITPSPTTADLNGVFFINENKGWAVGDSGTIAKYNAGSWSVTQITTPGSFSDVFFVSESTGYVTDGCAFTGDPANYRNLYKTTDSGATWVDLRVGDSDKIIYLFAVYFTDSNNGWVVGIDSGNNSTHAGKVFKTTNAGVDWIDVSPPTGEVADVEFWGVYFVDSNTGWVVGGNPDTGDGRVYYTSDGGTTWTRQYTTLPGELMFKDIHGASATALWAVDRGSISKFDGSTWVEEFYDPNTLGTIYFYGLYFKDEWNGWAVGGLSATKTGGPKRAIYKYVVDPYDLKQDRDIFITTSTQAAVSAAISGKNIQSDSTITFIDPTPGITISATLSATAPFKFELELTIQPTSIAKPGSYRFRVDNPSEGTFGTGDLQIRSTITIGEAEKKPVPVVSVYEAKPDGTPKNYYDPARDTQNPRVQFVSQTGTIIDVYVFDIYGKQVMKRTLEVKPGPVNVDLSRFTDDGFELSSGLYRVIVVAHGSPAGVVAKGSLIVHQ